MAKPKPWERQEGETSKAYAAFCVYRDLGRDRSQEKAAAALGKKRPIISKWSMNNDWVERVAAWDEEQDRIIRRELTKDIGKMRKRHADMAAAMLMKAARALSKIPDDEIKASDISRMVDVGSRLERLSRGDTSEVIEERDGGTAMDPVQFYIPNNHRNDTE